ncbi:MAG: DUF3455 domain-containing protein [Anaerolineae bacterium]
MITTPTLDTPRRIENNYVIDLGACHNLHVPAGNEIVFQAYAKGEQIYRWDGANWIYVAPRAVLFEDAQVKAMVGAHYVGPTWQSFSGSKVLGRVLQSCVVDSDAIPWLLLEAVAAERPGVFQQVTFIQQVNTAGGKAPTAPGRVIDEVVEVPYTAKYIFYQPNEPFPRTADDGVISPGAVR